MPASSSAWPASCARHASGCAASTSCWTSGNGRPMRSTASCSGARRAVPRRPTGLTHRQTHRQQQPCGRCSGPPPRPRCGPSSTTPLRSTTSRWTAPAPMERHGPGACGRVPAPMRKACSRATRAPGSGSTARRPQPRPRPPAPWRRVPRNRRHRPGRRPLLPQRRPPRPSRSRSASPCRTTCGHRSAWSRASPRSSRKTTAACSTVSATTTSTACWVLPHA